MSDRRYEDALQALTETLKDGDERLPSAADCGASGVVTSTKPRQKDRQGMKGLLTYHPPAVIQQLKIIGAEHDRNQQQLVIEALNMLFTKYGVQEDGIVMRDVSSREASWNPPMTDAEIDDAARSDPDNPPLTPEQLADMGKRSARFSFAGKTFSAEDLDAITHIIKLRDEEIGARQVAAQTIQSANKSIRHYEDRLRALGVRL